MDRLVNRGIGVLIPPDAGKRKGARPGWDGGLYAFMRRLLATDFGGELYAKRQGMIEPVFADTKFNRAHGPLLTPRQIGVSVGMAADRGDAQPRSSSTATRSRPPRPEGPAGAVAAATDPGPRRRTPRRRRAPLRDSHRPKRQSPDALGVVARSPSSTVT